MKTKSQDGRDLHQEFMEWVAAVAAYTSCPIDRDTPKSVEDKREITSSA